MNAACLLFSGLLLLSAPDHSDLFTTPIEEAEIQSIYAAEELLIFSRYESREEAIREEFYQEYLERVKAEEEKKAQEWLKAEHEAKEWIAFRESSGRYDVYSPCGRWYGRYQLTVSYLNGDLSPENQERVADEYVKNRYGNWQNAKAFWINHNWY